MLSGRVIFVLCYCSIIVLLLIVLLFVDLFKVVSMFSESE